MTTVRRVPAQHVARSQDSIENGSGVYRGRPRGRSACVAAALAGDPGLMSEYQGAESLGELLGFTG
ncbi:hypothetical protein [Rhodococcus qingshengii]|uniref:hypothetical protein n=1 Tax=Rhodococcus qingshengii TaxID=334542 RepID=UPI001ABF3294|nr:hypothetical protein [Rhodococcus qingshengii]